MIIPVQKDRIELARRAILSARLNGFGEIIVVGSALVKQRLSKIFDDIIFIECEGNTASRYNKGVDSATKEFIMLLNDDDFYLKIPEIYRSDNDFIFSDYYLLQGGQVGRFISKPTILKKTNYIGYMTVRIRSRILKRERFDESINYYEDYELWLRLQQKGLKMKYYPLAFAIYDTDFSCNRKSSVQEGFNELEDIKNKYDPGRRNLLIITTKGRPKHLRRALSSLQDKLDVMVINDGEDTLGEIEKICNNFGAGLITKPVAGLTDSWNKGFDYFMEKGYNSCILSSDNIRFPENFSRGLIKGLERYDLVSPLIGGGKISVSQEDLNKSEHEYSESSCVDKTCFAFSRSIERYKFSNQFLFNSKQDENDLCKRVIQEGGSIATCRTSFILRV